MASFAYRSALAGRTVGPGRDRSDFIGHVSEIYTGFYRARLRTRRCCSERAGFLPGHRLLLVLVSNNGVGSDALRCSTRYS